MGCSLSKTRYGAASPRTAAKAGPHGILQTSSTFAERGTDRRVQCRDLEALPQMGRRAHRCHPKCEGPSFFPEIENILENSDFITLLNQASGDRKILSERLNLSADQQKYIDNSEPGEGTADF